MSRAFVNEEIFATPESLPERQQSTTPNYVTPHGLNLLKQQIEALQQRQAELASGPDEVLKEHTLARLQTDLRYLKSRLDRAVVVDTSTLPEDEVHFGSTVEVRDENDELLTFSIVGEDEADAAHGLVSWASPLAKALMRAHVGDVVNWVRPSGATELEIVAIHQLD